MCGIFGCLKLQGIIDGRTKKELRKAFVKLKHRGPDQSVERYYGGCMMFGFHRLQIVDPTQQGMQPFESQSGRFACMVNGEIFNYRALIKKLQCVTAYEPKSSSDCEFLVHYFEYLVMNKDYLKNVSGQSVDTPVDNVLKVEFAFVIYDIQEQSLILSVDQLRVRPLFYGFTPQKSIHFASEQKALTSLCQTDAIRAVGAGQIVLVERYNNQVPQIIQDFSKFSSCSGSGPGRPLSDQMIPHQLRQLLMENMKRKLSQGDRDFGFLLSGGLDSSLVCAMASKLLYPRRIRTFTVGFSSGAPDILAAREVAKHLNTIHTEYVIPPTDAIRDIPNVIWFNESWDQTTTRASTPMRQCLLRMKRDHPEIAVVFSGEVADELLRGYLYNLKSPSPEEGLQDQIKRLQDITYFDGLRADRMVSSVSCELRLPFFSKDILRFIWSLDPRWIDPQSHNGIEKWLLRTAFDFDEEDEKLHFLPDSILWRTKDAFSDATSVKSSWKDLLKSHAEAFVTDSRHNWLQRYYIQRTGHGPQTKEDSWYREIFDEYGFNLECIPYKWMPTWCDETLTDSSATALDVYHQ